MSDKTKNIIEWIVCILVAVVLTLIIKYYLITPTIVKQVSMSPTLENNDRLLLNRWIRTVKSKPERGDIITFEAPSIKNYSLNQTNEQDSKAIYARNIEGVLRKFLYYVVEVTKESYIKRVIALEGEHIAILEDGTVYINEEKLEEPYLKQGLKTKRTGEFYDLVVPEGYIFVMGDNRDRSCDSREFGCIPLEKIEGKVICRFWPFNKIGRVQ